MGDENIPEWALRLPAVNASLNALATVLLVTGYVAIKRGRQTTHTVLMYAAFATSIVFLGCYLVYHYHVPSKTYPGTGAMRPIYYTLLISHVLLAAAVPFLALTTLWRAWRCQWNRHRRIAKVTFPIWLYVSVTGVIIYAMLYVWV